MLSGPFKRRQKCRLRQCLSFGKGIRDPSKSSKHVSRPNENRPSSVMCGGRPRFHSTVLNPTLASFFHSRNTGATRRRTFSRATPMVTRAKMVFSPARKTTTTTTTKTRRRKRWYRENPTTTIRTSGRRRKSIRPSRSPDRKRRRRTSTTDRVFLGKPKRMTLKLKNVDTPKSASLAPSTSSEAHRSSSSSKYKDKSKDKKARKMKKGGRGVLLVVTIIEILPDTRLGVNENGP